MFKVFLALSHIFVETGTAHAKDQAWPPEPAAPNRRRDAMERNNMMETTIPQGRTLHIQDGKSFELKVVAGCLWITQENDTEDKVLEAGETFRVTRNGLTLAHACKEVRLQIASSAQAGMPILTLGGGYRDFGAGVWRGMVAEWLSNVRAWIAAGRIGREASTARASRAFL
jgi:Protein of unknown function (DUF2917)